MPIDQLPFPDVIGARNTNGHVCVGSTPSRSRHCRTNLVFHLPPNPKEMRWIPGTYKTLATDVDWMQESKTTAVLLDGLRDVIHQKVDVLFDRGTVVGRMIGSRFYLMEVARGMLWPRYKWWLPYQIPEWNKAVPLLIRYETLHPRTLVAEPDNRPPSLELKHDPTEHLRAPVFMDGDHHEWLRELLAHRAVQTPDQTA